VLNARAGRPRIALRQRRRISLGPFTVRAAVCPRRPSPFRRELMRPCIATAHRPLPLTGKDPADTAITDRETCMSTDIDRGQKGLSTPSVPDQLRAWLNQAVETGTSDLHLIAGYPPVLRLHGDLIELSEPPLAEATCDLLYSLCPVDAVTRLEGMGKNCANSKRSNNLRHCHCLRGISLFSRGDRCQPNGRHRFSEVETPSVLVLRSRECGQW
jgi:hypothetical protein